MGVLADIGRSTFTTRFCLARSLFTRSISIACLSCRLGGSGTRRRHMPSELPDFETRKTKTSAVVEGSYVAMDSCMVLSRVFCTCSKVIQSNAGSSGLFHGRKSALANKAPRCFQERNLLNPSAASDHPIVSTHSNRLSTRSSCDGGKVQKNLSAACRCLPNIARSAGFNARPPVS